MQTGIRLADFIRKEMEQILQDWEEFAKTLHSAKHMGKTGLRDHARDMLLEIADYLDSHPRDAEHATELAGSAPDEGIESAAEVHGGDRHSHGFTVIETVGEFRALRLSVVSHWTRAFPVITGQQLDDLTLFHSAIDHAVAESLEQYAIEKEMETRLFGAILLSSPDPIFVLDLKGRFIYANKATADLFALEPGSIIGKSTSDLGFSFASDFQRNLDKVIADQSTYRGKFEHTFASGQGETFEYLLAPVLDDDKKTESTACIYRDVTERTRAEERIWYSAHHDHLTGLPNRRLFMDRLELEVKHAKRNGLPLAVLFMDLDGFKEVNDKLGHEAGDHLLSEVAERLTTCVRQDDTVARLGGDEFTVILTGTKRRHDAELVAQTIIDALALPFEITQQLVQISVSIGISFYPQDASSPVSLLETADKAMYRAKKTGANRMCFSDTLDNPARYSV